MEIKKNKMVIQNKWKAFWNMNGLIILGIIIQFFMLYGAIVFRGTF
jgi:hypothetical protein